VLVFELSKTRNEIAARSLNRHHDSGGSVFYQAITLGGL
jgi:hypothetical protein